jgi:hypothetical protein
MRVRWHRRVHASTAARPVAIGVPDGIVQVALPDGRQFALQRVRRVGQFGRLGPLELRFSRWRGAPTKLALTAEWTPDGRMPRICGTTTFHGAAFFGARHTLTGRPLDPFGRNVYVDALRGGRWLRIMGVLTRPRGFALLVRKLAWRGSAYKAYVPGPNVGGQLAPDAEATIPAPPRSAHDACPFPRGVYAHA